MSVLAERPASAQLELPLTEREQDQLRRCEAVIEEGLRTFHAVGNALLTIRDQQLYRQTHETFDAYCRERWNLKTSRAYQLMDAGGVMTTLAEDPAIRELPANEAQVRPLTALPTPEEQRAAWREVEETVPESERTAADVQAVVNKRLGREPKKTGVSDVGGRVSDTTAEPSAVTATAPALIAEPVQEVLPPSPPAPLPAPVAPAQPAASAESTAASGRMVIHLVPESEDQWLAENRLTAGVAIARLREMQSQAEFAKRFGARWAALLPRWHALAEHFGFPSVVEFLEDRTDLWEQQIRREQGASTDDNS